MLCAEEGLQMTKCIKPHDKINIVVYILLSFLMICMIEMTIKYPTNNLISWQMLLGTLIGTILLLIVGKKWNRIYDKIGRKSAIYWMCLGMFGIALYAVSMSREDNRYTMIDYQQIYSAAADLAVGKEITNENYFLTYSNNLKPMLLLSVLFRIADFMHLPAFHFVLGINVLQILLVIWGCGYLAERNGDSRWRFPILMAYVFFLPIWGMASVFYTDSMSFGLGILGLAMLKKAHNTDGKARWCWLGGASAYLVLAIAWKITAIIPVIAAVIIVLWQKVQSDRKNIIEFLIIFGALSMMLSIWTNKYDIARQAKTTANPLISWVALGIKGNGSWDNNREFILNLNELATTHEKKEYALNYIKENKNSFFDLEHLIQKNSQNFANGNMGVREFLFIEKDDGTFLWNLFSPWGKYYWRMSQYCFCYLSSIYMLLMLGMFQCVIEIFRGREVSPLLMVCQLSFFGIYIFLMLWEANNRQMYNQMPGLILGAVLSLREILLNKPIKNSD